MRVEISELGSPLIVINVDVLHARIGLAIPVQRQPRALKSRRSAAFGSKCGAALGDQGGHPVLRRPGKLGIRRERG